jgi:hypothetical protein
LSGRRLTPPPVSISYFFFGVVPHTGLHVPQSHNSPFELQRIPTRSGFILLATDSSISPHTDSWPEHTPLASMPVHFLKQIAFAGALAANKAGPASIAIINPERSKRIFRLRCSPLVATLGLSHRNLWLPRRAASVSHAGRAAVDCYFAATTMIST